MRPGRLGQRPRDDSGQDYAASLRRGLTVRCEDPGAARRHGAPTGCGLRGDRLPPIASGTALDIMSPGASARDPGMVSPSASIVTTNRLPTDPRIAAKLRSRRRLRVLLAFTVVSLGLYVFIRLDRSAAERLGPVAEVIYNLFNGTPGDSPPLTPAARRFAADIRAMGGHPSVSMTSRGYFGIIGQAESLHASFDGPKFDDAVLARLATQYGDRIDSLAIEYTGVTDAGLSNLSKFTSLTPSRHTQRTRQARAPGGAWAYHRRGAL